MAPRERWERALVEMPAQVYTAGPPNWLVQESKRSGESEPDCATRLRLELGIDVPMQAPIVPTNVPTPAVVPTVNGDLCEACGEKPREGRYRECSRCRKRRQRS